MNIKLFGIIFVIISALILVSGLAAYLFIFTAYEIQKMFGEIAAVFFTILAGISIVSFGFYLLFVYLEDKEQADT